MCIYMQDTAVIYFFTVSTPTEFYTLSLHDALPICLLADRPARPALPQRGGPAAARPDRPAAPGLPRDRPEDRKSTRLNSSHVRISYAVFCLKKKNKKSTKSINTIKMIIHLDTIITV